MSSDLGHLHTKSTSGRPLPQIPPVQLTAAVKEDNALSALTDARLAIIKFCDKAAQSRMYPLFDGAMQDLLEAVKTSPGLPADDRISRRAKSVHDIIVKVLTGPPESVHRGLGDWDNILIDVALVTREAANIVVDYLSVPTLGSSLTMKNRIQILDKRVETIQNRYDQTLLQAGTSHSSVSQPPGLVASSNGSLRSNERRVDSQHSGSTGGTRRPLSRIHSLMKDVANSAVEYYDSNIPTISVKEFCRDVESERSFSSKTKVHQIILKKKNPFFSLRHELLLFKVELPYHGHGERIIWLRMERAGTFDALGDTSIEMTAKDTVKIARSKSMLANKHFDERARVTFCPPETVSLSTLRCLLWSFIEESPRYNLIFANCYFFCSTVIKLLCEKYPHTLVGSVGHEELSEDVRLEVRRRFAALLSEPFPSA